MIHSKYIGECVSRRVVEHASHDKVLELALLPYVGSFKRACRAAAATALSEDFRAHFEGDYVSSSWSPLGVSIRVN
jgi:hypothetical protein